VYLQAVLRKQPPSQWDLVDRADHDHLEAQVEQSFSECETTQEVAQPGGCLCIASQRHQRRSHPSSNDFWRT